MGESASERYKLLLGLDSKLFRIPFALRGDGSPAPPLQKLGHGGLSRLHLWPLISSGILSAPPQTLR